ncbi:DUF998 domain-containing protein [Euzebya pacifica]|jgi:hypothetical membrane protein|uniref:DUF998 domain-containing protein n=1 Tax=Euzebya pacifica TaxID=1608957 RepID=UPI0030F58BB2
MFGAYDAADGTDGALTGRMIPVSPPPLPRSVLVGAWAAILGPIVYVTTWAVAGALRNGYSPTRDAISELGELGASTAPAMTAAFVLFGLSALPFARVADRLPGAGRLLQVAIVVTGVATAGAGVFPCSAGCPGPGSSFTDNGHSVVATVGYIALMACPLLSGRAAIHAGARRFGWTSVALGAVGVLGMTAWVLGLAGDAHGGLLQRGFNTVADVWWVMAGVVLLTGTASARNTRTPKDVERSTTDSTHWERR